MEPKLLFDRCLTVASSVMQQVNASQYHDPTPDTEWDVSKLVNHMLYELSWAPDILAGKTIAEVGDKYDGDLIGQDVHLSWQQAEVIGRQSVDQVNLETMIHLSYGDFPARHYIQQLANDLLLHAWDLGTAIGVVVKFNPGIAEELYTAALPGKAELAATGLFAPAIDVPDSADIQTKLLALFGRQA